ncbi:hypothetical protein M4D57_23950, partial [Brevibacillus borstelensis]
KPFHYLCLKFKRVCHFPHKEYPLQLNSNGLSFYCLLKGDNITGEGRAIFDHAIVFNITGVPLERGCLSASRRTEP